MGFADPGVGSEVVTELPPRRAARRRSGPLRVAQAALSLVVVAAIFVLVLPQIASYSSVWQTLTTLGWPQVTALAAVSIFNLFTYWAQMVAAMPGLTMAQAAVNNQSSTTVANVLPGGGAIAVGVAVAMFRSWGFTGPEIGLLISTTGVRAAGPSRWASPSPCSGPGASPAPRSACSSRPRASGTAS